MANIPGSPNYPSGSALLDGYSYIRDDDYMVDRYLHNISTAGVTQPRTGFVYLLKTYKPKIVRQVVAKNYPEWLEELDKLLILK